MGREGVREEGEGWSSRNIGDLHHQILTSMLGNIVRHGGSCLCTGKIANAEAKKLIAYPVPLLRGKGTNIPSPVELSVAAAGCSGSRFGIHGPSMASMVHPWWPGSSVGCNSYDFIV